MISTVSQAITICCVLHWLPATITDSQQRTHGALLLTIVLGRCYGCIIILVCFVVEIQNWNNKSKLSGLFCDTLYNPEKKTTQNTAKQNYPGSVASHDREMRWAYSTMLPSPHRTTDVSNYLCKMVANLTGT